MRDGVRINYDRLARQLEELATVGGTADGSCCRIALTDSDRAGRDLVVSWMREAGMTVRIDPIGNIIAVRDGTRGGPPVMTGSHIDTVATGGRYDGAYGVLAGLEVMRTLNDAALQTERPLAVTVFTNEEGVRFAPDMMGSLVFSGQLSLEEALRSPSTDGAILGRELERIGYSGSGPCGSPRPCSFVELHVEQGPVLDGNRESLAIATSVPAISWQEITIRGAANHAGTTPLEFRHDAAYCAARIAVHARELSEASSALAATVGAITVVPGLINVIASDAQVMLDMRSSSDESLAAAIQRVSHLLQRLRVDEGVEIEARQLVRADAVRFDDAVVNAIRDSAGDLGHEKVRLMHSGAGHDAQMMARLCPTAMIFVPSVGGISHSPKEHTEPEHLELGANVLLHTMRRLAACTDPSNGPGLTSAP